jgi:sporulation protein YlmC with PRC-barrel domain
MRTSSVVYAFGLLMIIAPSPLTVSCGRAPMGAAFAASPLKHAGNGPPAAEIRSEATTNNALESVLGREVRTSTDRDVGRIIDVLVDRNGRVEAVVIEFGGFLGIGTRKIAVDWSAVRFDAGGDRSVLPVDVTHDQLRIAPEYRPNEPAVVPRASN